MYVMYQEAAALGLIPEMSGSFRVNTASVEGMRQRKQFGQLKGRTSPALSRMSGSQLRDGA